MIRVFPVPETTGWSDTFGAPRGGGRKHEGEDIFAAKGARVLAVDDGLVRTSVEGTGGNVVYERSDDGDLTYYAHLDTWSDAMPAPGGDYAVRVKAGDVIGTVGNTGNARTTPAHLHFQWKPQGATAFQNPYAALKSVQGGQAPPGPPPPPSTSAGRRVTSPLLAKALVWAWAEAHALAAPPAPGLTIALAQALMEGALSDVARGTNNIGSMHATRDFVRAHASDAGYGTFALLDVNADGYYIGRFMIFPTLLRGTAAFLSRVEQDVDLNTVTTTADYTTQLYLSGYYTMTNKPVTPLAKRRQAAKDGTLTDADKQNIAEYTALVNGLMGQAAWGIGRAALEPLDPTDVTVGPPFAPLANRLTNRPPNTLEHARQLLGKRAEHPPTGAISLQEALDAPNGDGVWLFPLRAEPKPAPKPEPKPPPAAVRSASAGEQLALALLAFAGAGAAVTGAAYAAHRYERRRAA